MEGSWHPFEYSKLFHNVAQVISKRNWNPTPANPKIFRGLYIWSNRPVLIGLKNHKLSKAFLMEVLMTSVLGNISSTVDTSFVTLEIESRISCVFIFLSLYFSFSLSVYFCLSFLIFVFFIYHLLFSLSFYFFLANCHELASWSPAVADRCVWKFLVWRNVLSGFSQIQSLVNCYPLITISG